MDTLCKLIFIYLYITLTFLNKKANYYYLFYYLIINYLLRVGTPVLRGQLLQILLIPLLQLNDKVLFALTCYTKVLGSYERQILFLLSLYTPCYYSHELPLSHVAVIQIF